MRSTREPNFCHKEAEKAQKSTELFLRFFCASLWQKTLVMFCDLSPP